MPLTMRVLVTGGAGFIGTHLVQRLLGLGEDVVVLDSLEDQVHDGATYSPPAGVRFVRGGVGDEAVVDDALDGIDRVVHLAAAVGVGQSMYEIARYVRANTMATATFLERLVHRDPRPRRLVVASSMSIYGEGSYVCPEHGLVAPGPRSEEQLAARRWELTCAACGAELEPVPTAESKPLIPTSVYAITKRDHEELCLVAGAAYGIETVALRFFNVYGPGQALSNPYTGAAAIFSSRLLNGRPPVIFEDGRQSRDFIHVSDIVEGVLLALESKSAVGETLNLATGRPVTIATLARLIADGLGRDIDPEYAQQYRAGDIRHCYADTARAKALLGFEARVRLEEGISDLVAWVRERTAADRIDDAVAELTARGLAR
jgi:dTDP-L-rhamnose 4-epimerase